MPPTKKSAKKTAPHKKAAARRTTPLQDRAAGKPVPSATELPDKYAATAWGATPGNVLDGVVEDVQVPSGQMCLARRPGVQGLIAAGILDHVDSLTALVGEKHIKRAKGGKPIAVDAEAFAKDPKKVMEMLDVVDKIICHIVLRPNIKPSPRCEACNMNIEWHQWADVAEVDHAPVFQVEDGVVYAFMVDLDDKMFLVNFAVGGSRSLERFHRDAPELVERVEPQ